MNKPCSPVLQVLPLGVLSIGATFVAAVMIPRVWLSGSA